MKLITTNKNKKYKLYLKTDSFESNLMLEYVQKIEYGLKTKWQEYIIDTADFYNHFGNKRGMEIIGVDKVLDMETIKELKGIAFKAMQY